MRLNFAKTAIAAAIPLFMLAGPALADEQHDKLLKMCTENDPAPATCECQVTAIEANMDAKVLKAFIATMEAGTSGATPEDAEKASQAALDEAGMTKEEFDKAMADAMAKIEPGMEACKKA